MRNSSKLTNKDHLKKTIKEKGIYNKVFSNDFFVAFLEGHKLVLRKRFFTPENLLWCFINQVLNEDHSCRAVVAAMMAKIVSESGKKISLATGAYCQARQKLPLDFLKSLCKQIAERIDEHTESLVWKGHNIKLIDGSELRMPVTEENEKVYSRHKESNGLLKCRIVGVFSLAHGAILDLKIGPFLGKGSGELSLFRKLYDTFTSKDLLIMDRLYCSYYDFVQLLERSANFIVRLKKNSKSKTIIRKLGKKDYLIKYKCTLTAKSMLSSDKTIPDYLELREITYTYKRKGFKSKKVILLTSLTDFEKYTFDDIVNLYTERWNVEIDLRSIKTFLKMDVLRGKCPDMVEKEIWMHIFTYNHIRTIMVDAAIFHGVSPREVSFKETLQLLNAFKIYMYSSSKRKREEYYFIILASLVDRVKNRPGRIEPRALRNSYRRFRLLKVSRKEGRKINWVRSGKNLSKKDKLDIQKLNMMEQKLAA